MVGYAWRELGFVYTKVDNEDTTSLINKFEQAEETCSHFDNLIN